MPRVYKATYEDVYNLHAKYGRVPPQDRDDGYWVSLVEEARGYGKEHGDTFTMHLLAAMLVELEREHMEVHKSGK